MAEVIGALRVVIGADTASLEKGLKSAQGSMTGFANAGKVAAGVFTAVIGGLVVAMKGVINQADELGKLGQSIGVPVEELSKLKFAADLSGVSMETFAGAMTRLSKNMNEVASKASGPAAAAFKALGIEVKNADGSLKSGSTVISEIAGKFVGFRDGAAKTALAVALLGRSGAELIPLLNAGSAGIQRMKDEAARLGIVITEETFKASENFNDSITRLGAGINGLRVNVLAALAPALRTLTDQFVILSSSGRNFVSVAEFIATVLKLLTSSVLTTVSGFIALGQVFSGFFAASQRGWTDFAGRIADVKAGVEAAKGTLLNAGAALKSFWSTAAGSGMDQEFRLPGFFKEVTKDAPTFSAAAVGGATNALNSFLASLAKKTATLQAESETIGKSIAEQERLRIVYEALAIAKEKNITVTEALRQKIDQAAVSYGNLAQKVDEMKDRFNVVKSAMEGVAKKFEDALVGIADGTKTAKEAFADMTKAIISDLIRMMVQLQVTLPLARALTGAFGGPVSSLAGVGGFKLPGFAHGGSFTVPGSGGVDSRVAAFRVTPGERVTVQKPGSSAEGNVFSPTYLIDARGADAAAVARIEQGLRERDRTFNDRVFSVQRKMSVRGGRP